MLKFIWRTGRKVLQNKSLVHIASILFQMSMYFTSATLLGLLLSAAESEFMLKNKGPRVIEKTLRGPQSQNFKKVREPLT